MKCSTDHHATEPRQAISQNAGHTHAYYAHYTINRIISVPQWLTYKKIRIIGKAYKRKTFKVVQYLPTRVKFNDPTAFSM